MAVRDDDGLDLELVLFELGGDFGELTARVDDDGFLRLFVAENGAVAAELADRQNDVDHVLGFIVTFARPLCCLLMSETPIFDLEEGPPKAASVWRPRGIGALIGLAIATAFILADQSKSPAWHWPRFNLLLLVPGLYLATAIHELGHVLAGAL